MDLVINTIIVIAVLVLGIASARSANRARGRLAASPQGLLKEGRTATERAQIITRLAKTQTVDEVLDEIELNLGSLSNDPATASVATDILVELPTERATDLLRTLQSGLGWKQRVALVDRLKNRGDEVSHRRLLQVIEVARDQRLPYVARAGVQALGDFPVSDASEAQLVFCSQSPSEHLALAAVEALGERGSENAVGAVREAARSRALRAAANRALERMRARHRTATERADLLKHFAQTKPVDEVLDEIELNLASLTSDPITAKVAAEILVGLQNPRASELFLSLQSDLDWRDRIALIDRLKDAGDEVSLQRLLQLIENAREQRLPYVARAGVQALEQFPASDDSERHLISCSRSPVDHLALAAVEVLGEKGSVDAVAALREAARSRVLKAAANRAIDRIRERHRTAPQGALALARQSDSGKLSLVDSPGSLSIAEQEQE